MDALVSPWSPRYCQPATELWYVPEWGGAIWSHLLVAQYKQNLLLRALVDNVTMAN